jgi:hypothetical protein
MFCRVSDYLNGGSSRSKSFFSYLFPLNKEGGALQNFMAVMLHEKLGI